MRHRKKKILLSIIIILIVAVGATATFYIVRKDETKEKQEKEKQPEELLVEYMNHIEKKEYEEMYIMLYEDRTNKEEFISRNAKIYEGIGIKNMKLSNITSTHEKGDRVSVAYDSSFKTLAGEIRFSNNAIFQHTEEGYKLLWKDSLIFPDLTETDKVKVSVSKAERGQILDRNGKVLAGKGVASSVGIVPGKLEDKENSLKKIAKLLDIKVETIEKQLQAKWVKSDSFVPIATLRKINKLDVSKIEPDPEVLEEYDRQQKLLNILGVMMTDTEIRSYNLGKAASHLIGYVQTVTAEDLKEHEGEGYSANSVIGRSGMEGLYEKELKGQDGCAITIMDEDGNSKKELVAIVKQDGQNIKLTIDSELQQSLYDQFQKDRGCSVAMNPYTGEVLALVSTPSYDDNGFILGLSKEQWDTLNNDKNKPLYNRFRQVWCPGSTLKPIMAEIGLMTGSIDPNEDYGNVGLSWQKDASWGAYKVTTTHAYDPVVLKNALIYSDNIYFAKVALKIGADKLATSLDTLGFNKEIPFEITMAPSQYSNTEKIETEIQLADSGYGQGQVLVNPLHLASLYTSLLNEGNIIKPYLKYNDEPKGEVWIPQAFDKLYVDTVLEGVKAVVNDPNGTGYAAHRKDYTLAGKTGTAELKATKEDKTGTEIGWFSVFTTDKNVKKPVVIVSMVENVKDIGGSEYVVKKDKAVLEKYLK